MGKGKKGFQPGNTLGKPFDSNYQPKVKGRKPALYKELLSITKKKVEFELSKEDYYKIIRFLMELTPNKLKEIAKNENTPVWVSNIISAIFIDVRMGRINTLNILFDRLFGKSTQVIEAEIDANITNKQEIDLSVLTTEELLIYHSFLEKISNQDKNNK